MTRSLFLFLLAFGIVSLGAIQNLQAVEGDSADSQKGTKSASTLPGSKQKDVSRKTYTVSPRPLRIEESVEGHLVATEMAEISVWPESWSDFKIKEVVPHGAHVQKGETLLQFDDKHLNKAIADLELDLNLGELRINRAEQEIPRKERSLERQLANAEEALKRIKEDYERYRETEREQSIDSANMSLKMAKFNLDYYKDELEQLQKMYEADDLTEETEEIVLRRQKFMVEYGTFNYEMSKYYHDQMLNVNIPRRDHDMEKSLEKVEELVEDAQIASQIDTNVARYELEKQRSQRKEALDKHIKLLSDRGLMAIKSPIAGVVYYGQSTDGKWSKIADLRQKLIPGKAADKQSVLLTVLDVSELEVLALLDEKLRIGIKSGQSVKVQPVAEGSDPLEAKVASISSTPVTDGKFELKVDLTGDSPEWLVPGMSCKVEVVTYEKQDALLVPKEAVHEDDATDREYVRVVQDEKVKKTWVETGRSKGKNIEITSGLAAGDVVSLEDEED
ncbi:efflux RND transporter periplasmic adaptor subunit [Bythopirellula polymerisocia]|uniref:Periplasmic multidrug efflux lipoprotein n=1 Tax=Bythopirellula polymerisocia TaxID=2528003 RepID=A0A5C6CZH5_9BACT|nr:HlyD family efflux transporter periplasmic adaptor subunit [Bythopirellula polymerisocia]TWU30283.1 periplasmic multidrug efflux lipoprotein precursor [Bythopirellula polymerisocia]